MSCKHITTDNQAEARRIRGRWYDASRGEWICEAPACESKLAGATPGQVEATTVAAMPGLLGPSLNQGDKDMNIPWIHVGNKEVGRFNGAILERSVGENGDRSRCRPTTAKALTEAMAASERRAVDAKADTEDAESYEIGGYGVEMYPSQARRWNTGGPTAADLRTIVVHIGGETYCSLADATCYAKQPEVAAAMDSMPANRVS